MSTDNDTACDTALEHEIVSPTGKAKIILCLGCRFVRAFADDMVVAYGGIDTKEDMVRLLEEAISASKGEAKADFQYLLTETGSDEEAEYEAKYADYFADAA